MSKATSGNTQAAERLSSDSTPHSHMPQTLPGLLNIPDHEVLNITMPTDCGTASCRQHTLSTQPALLSLPQPTPWPTLA